MKPRHWVYGMAIGTIAALFGLYLLPKVLPALAHGGQLDAANRPSVRAGAPSENTSGAAEENSPSRVDATSTTKIPATNAAAIRNVNSFSPLLNALNRPLEELTHDELSLRGYLTQQCELIAFLRDDAPGFGKTILKAQAAGASSSQAQFAAAQVLARACEGVPNEMLSEGARQRLIAETLRRRDHPLNALLSVPVLETTGGADDTIRKILNSGDIWAIRGYLSGSRIQMSGSDALDDAGRERATASLRNAWEWAACDLAGGCGRESLPLLVACVVRAQCDANDISQLFRQTLPKDFQEIDASRTRATEAFATGNWDWLLSRRPRMSAEVERSK